MCVDIFFNIFLQHKLGMLTTGIWDENNDDDDDDELSHNFDDEDNDFGLAYCLFFLSYK